MLLNILKNPPMKKVSVCSCFNKHGYLTVEGYKCGKCSSFYSTMDEIDYPAWEKQIKAMIPQEESLERHYSLWNEAIRQTLKNMGGEE